MKSVALFLSLMLAVPVSAAPASPSWSAFVHDFIEENLRQDPVTATRQGRHEYDGLLPDLSPAGLASKSQSLQNSLQKAQAFDNLDADQRFERDYVCAEIRKQLFWLNVADLAHTNPSYYVDQLDPAVYATVPYAPVETRLKAYLKYLGSVPDFVSQMTARLKTPMSAPMIDFAVNGFSGYADYYQHDGKAAFADAKDPALQKELDQKIKAAVAAMNKTVAWFNAQRPNATDNFALGKEKFAQMLHDTEMVDQPLAQLKAIGLRDLARNQAALIAACKQYKPKASVQDCMQAMRDDKPQGDLVANANKTLTLLKDFIQKKKFVSIPAKEPVRAEEAPAYNRQNAAYIIIPGPYEKNMPSIYYIAPPDPNWPEQVQRDFLWGNSVVLNTSVHEVWPGHFLQFLHAKASKSFFGRLYVGYGFAEGWAHYAEQLVWEQRHSNAEDHIGQISDALMRDCRYLSAIGLHTEGMTLEQSKKLFIDACYQDEGTAIQQAARGAYDPAYLNYTLGKLMILKLREDWRKKTGGSLRRFHDTFLSFGGPPIPLIRRAMLGEDGPTKSSAL